MSTILYTGAEHFAQYIAEATYGVTPATPAFQWIGPMQNQEPDFDRSLIKLLATGSRDLAYIIKGLAKFGAHLEYCYQNKTFLNYVMTLGSFTLETWLTKGGTINSYLHTGGVLNSVALQASVERLVTVKPEIFCQNSTPSSAHPTGATYSNDPGIVPKAWFDSQVSITPSGGSAAVVDGLTDLTFTIHNNLHRFPVIRSTSGDLLKFMVERHRQLTGELTVAYIDSTLMADIINSTEVTLAFVIGADTFTFNNAKFDTGRLTARPVEVIPQRLPFTAKTLTIT